MAQVRQPKGIKKQAEVARKLQEELLKNPDEKPALEPAKEPNPAVTADPAPDGGEEKNLVQPVKEAEGAEPDAIPETDWKKRFNGLKSTYDREVPKLRSELSIAHSQVSDFKSQLEDVNRKLEQLELTPVAAAPEPVVFTDEEREQYGEGYISMMEKVAEQSTSDIVKQLMDVQQQLADVRNGQKETKQETVQTAEESFFRELDETVGRDWDAINSSPEFIEFLNQNVPSTGQTKMHFIRKGRKNLDAKVVSEIFNEFKAMSKTGGSQEAEPVSIPEELVTPENSGGGVPPIPEQRIYTSSEVTQFYTDKTKGRYKGKEDEAREIEKDIINAGRTGRIVTNRGVVSA